LSQEHSFSPLWLVFLELKRGLTAHTKYPRAHGSLAEEIILILVKFDLISRLDSQNVRTRNRRSLIRSIKKFIKSKT